MGPIFIYFLLVLRELLVLTSEGEVGVAWPDGKTAGRSPPGNPWLVIGDSLIAGVLSKTILRAGRTLFFLKVVLEDVLLLFGVSPGFASLSTSLFLVPAGGDGRFPGCCDPGRGSRLPVPACSLVGRKGPKDSCPHIGFETPPPAAAPPAAGLKVGLELGWGSGWGWVWGRGVENSSSSLGMVIIRLFDEFILF